MEKIQTSPRPQTAPPIMPAWSPTTIQPTPAPPMAPRCWAAAAERLSALAGESAPPPWRDNAPYRASVEIRSDPAIHHLVDKTSPIGDRTALCFYLTLAGWGQVRLGQAPPRKLSPGDGFFALTGAAPANLQLPAESDGWLFVRIEMNHPYLMARLAQQVSSVGPFIELAADDAMSHAVIRLVGGELAHEFPDHFAAELALFEFVLAYEQRTRRILTGPDIDERLLAEVRRLVMEGLPNAVEVTALAKRFGMSRSHFSRYFRSRTGTSPAHFATSVRLERAEALLLETHEPLKVIADSCGFANANHLCKVFRRFRHCSPAAFRKSLRLVTPPPGHGENFAFLGK
jgi:AraC-like DNA-binding protein